MSERIVEVQDSWREHGLVDDAKYKELYKAITQALARVGFR